MRAIGVDVLIGSRDPERARELAVVHGVSGGANEDVVRDADLVVLSVPGRTALETARGLADAIGTTPVLSVASDLRFTEDGVLPGRLGRSLAEEVADVLSAPLAAGFQSLAAAHLAAADPPDEDVLVCGDEPEAKDVALELGARLVRGRAIDAGPLANARALEAMTAVILNVNRRYGARAGIRLTGIP
jgi:8-hydroxy-5-deazaflavin:NADPH oxidoreductase